jgi:hypothetical protein
VGHGHVRGGLSGLAVESARDEEVATTRTDEIVQLYGGDSLVDTRDDFLCNGGCVDMFGIQSVT